jgi:hypothetical protein
MSISDLHASKTEYNFSETSKKSWYKAVGCIKYIPIIVVGTGEMS